MSDVNLPPASVPAERSVLGSMLRLNACIADVAPLLRAEDFYVEAHQRVYAAAVALWDKGKPADLVTIADRLRECGHIQQPDYPLLGELWDAAPTAAHAEHYARIVRDKAISRKLLHAAREIQKDAQDGLMPAGELLEKAERGVFAVAQLGAEGQSVPLADVLRRASDAIDARMAPGGRCGLPTGYLDIDRILCGLKDGEVTVVAARTSVGKTSLALGVAYHVAAVEGEPVLFVSLEQSAAELGERLLCLHTGVDSHRVKGGRLDAGDVAALAQGTRDLRGVPLHVDDTAGQSALRIGANARRLKARKGIRLVVVDYLQLVEPEARKENRQEQVAGVSRRMKHLARELQVPVVALAQLNRGPEEGQGRRPRLSDLRESDAVAHDADAVLLLWRPGAAEEKQRPDWPPAERPVEAPCVEVECIVAKNRNGPTGVAQLIFRRACMRFENLAVDV